MLTIDKFIGVEKKRLPLSIIGVAITFFCLELHYKSYPHKRNIFLMNDLLF